VLWSCVQTKSVDPHQDRLILLRIFCGNFFADFSFLTFLPEFCKKTMYDRNQASFRALSIYTASRV